MSVYMKEIFQETYETFKLDWICGLASRQIVNWFYVAEDIGNVDFLKENELVITTGFAYDHKEEWLLNFIKELIRRKACGLILNIGKYITIDDITPQIMTLCDTYNFPLLTMPWEMSLSDFSQICCNRIIEDRQKDFTISTALKAILLEPAPSPHVLEVLAANSIYPDDKYTLAIAEIPASQISFSRVQQEVSALARHCQTAPSKGFITFEHNRQIVLVWHNTHKQIVKLHMRELAQICASRSHISGTTIGLSEQGSSLSDLKILYRHAKSALLIAEKTAEPLKNYEDLGCYQLFSEIQDLSLLKAYYRRYLGVLEDYDQKHNSYYIETLDNYLKYNGHLGTIADVMICHKNTVNYRMTKIRELTQYDLNDGDIRYNLQLAISIYNYLKMIA